MLTRANIDDCKPVSELTADWEAEALLADKGYLGSDFQRSLLENLEIVVYPLPKSDTKLSADEKVLRQFLFKARRRIETTCSQLVDQLNLQRVRAKSLWGLRTRLATKFLSFSFAYLINILIGY